MAVIPHLVVFCQSTFTCKGNEAEEDKLNTEGLSMMTLVANEVSVK